MLEALDRHKFGIVAVFVTYIIIFVYSNYTTFTYYPPVEPFLEQARIENKNEILEVTPDDIEVPNDFDFSQDVKNIAQSVNDDRESSMDDYSPNTSPEHIAQDIRNLEAQMKQEAGGSSKRAELQRLIDQRKEEQKRAAENTNNRQENAGGSDKKYGGYTMVDWDLSNRKPHNNNSYYVRNPGYTCNENANGIVVVNVRANKNGDIIAATYDESKSSNATSCMIQNAIKYAKLSRFEYSTQTSQQTGYIKYTFVYKK